MARALEARTYARKISLCFVALCCAAAVAFYLVPSETLKNVAWLVIIAGTAAVTKIGMRIHDSEGERHWRHFFRAMLLFLCGGVAAVWEAASGLAPTVRMGWSDALTIAGYFSLLAALLVLARARAPKGGLADLIDALIIVGGIALTLWIVWIGPLVTTSDLSAFERLSAIAFPLFNLTILTLLLRLTFTPGPRSRAYLLLIGAVLASLTASQWNLVALQDGSYAPGHPLELARMLAYALAGLAVLHPSMAELGRPVPGAGSVLTQPRLLMFGLAWVAAPVAFMWRWAMGLPVDPAAVILASSCIFFLMIIRMWTLLQNIRRSEEHFRALVHNSADGIVLIGDDGKIKYVSETTTSILGYSADELMSGDNGFEFVARPDVDPARAGYARVFEQPGAKTSLAIRVTRKDGSLRWLDVDMVNLLEHPSVAGIVINFRDTTDKRASEERARESEERFRSLVQHSSDAIVVVDREFEVTYASPSFERLTGVAGAELSSRRLTHWFAAPDARRIEDAALLPREDDRFSVLTCELKCDGGDEVAVEVVLTNMLDDAAVGGIVLNIRDVSDRLLLEKQLRHQAFHDPLTNLANRALFLDRLTHALERGSRSDEACFVMFLDLDNFKRVNDGHGHNIGDECLRTIAHRLLACSRVSDTVARMGGDEFAILLEATTVEGAVLLADRVLRKMSEPLEVSSGEVVLTPSIGIAPASAGEDAKSILRNADVAMYLAKRGDRQYEVFETAMYAETVRRIEVESELRAALAHHQFDIHLQPIVDLETGEPLGAEALVRWEHPERGTVFPGDFIDVAEDTGLIVPIGTSVLRRACRVLAGWSRDERTSSLTMSVNLSAKQLRDVAIVDELRYALEDAGARPELLTLEITESVMAEDVDETIERLTQLKELGVRLAIDDFGTGYSSLSYLQNFPIDILKIDRSFISQLDADAEGSSLARTIIGIGQSLRLTTVAEGVETQEQSRALSELGCSRGQGYLFAKPRPVDAFVAYVRDWTPARSLTGVTS
ncbi:MAG: EAL domain-containing protein [Actinomycetota bacterium]|nr:EAL domain-containing protein [Actinomycetota bacterium]